MNLTDWLTGILSVLNLSGYNLLWAVRIFLLLSVGGLFVVGLLVVRMPATYFCEPSMNDSSVGKRKGVSWWLVRIAKNVLGGVTILVGAVLALPGIPGPGLLIMLFGIMLADFPGKRRLERWMVSQPGILAAINRLRNRHGKPPMVLEDGLTASGRKHS